MRKLLLIVFYIFSLNVLFAQEAEADMEESENIDIVENPQVDQIDQNLVVKKINFIGLKKTRDSYIQSKVKKYLGKTVGEVDLHELETDLQLEDLFNEINFSMEATSESEAEINITVKEKITFVPLPFVMCSNSGFTAGGIVMDTNAFGRKDMFMLGGFFSSTRKTGMIGFTKKEKDHGIPGVSIFFSASSLIPEINNVEDELLLKFKAKAFGTSLALKEKIGEHFSFTNAFSFSYCSTDEESEYEGMNPESIKKGSTSLNFAYSNSDWNGVFMSTNSASISSEFGITDLEEDLKYPIGLAFSVSEQHPIIFDRLRIYQAISGFYGKNYHLTNYVDGGAGSVTILSSNFITDRIIGGNAGLEAAIAKFGWGMISIYGDYQLVYTKDFKLSDDDKEYELMHGPNGGIRFYLAKIAFPALAVGLSYNATKEYWNFTASLGMSF